MQERPKIGGMPQRLADNAVSQVARRFAAWGHGSIPLAEILPGHRREARRSVEPCALRRANRWRTSHQANLQRKHGTRRPERELSRRPHGSGSIVFGSYYSSGTQYGFLYDGTSYTTIAPTGSVGTTVNGVSGNNVVGSYTSYDGTQNQTYGFLYDGTNYTTLNPTGPSPPTPTASPVTWWSVTTWSPVPPTASCTSPVQVCLLPPNPPRSRYSASASQA